MKQISESTPLALLTHLTPCAKELLHFTALQYMLDTLCENPGLGKVYVDHAVNPGTCILLWKRTLFMGGALTQGCLDYLRDEILTADIRSNLRTFSIFYPDDMWKDALISLFPGQISQHERSLFSCVPPGTAPVSGHDEIVPITADLMHSSVGNFDMIRNEIIETGTYNDMADFYERGFGFTPVIDNQVCGFCTSEYPSKDAVAIGIEVLAAYQRQGYAKAMTRRFLQHAAKRGLTVFWECWKNNLASANTARSCGFSLVASYPSLFLDLWRKDPM